ncbi:MAG: protein kinase [Acidobacteriota bacterium]|nr:protein kinase [Acidobacteriota bacterium]
MIGKTILHYQVLSQVGSGGMGVVYAARDTRLGRMVALKVLPPEKSRDPKRRQRFLREARASAALNHPNIVNIYDIGSDQETDFIAMELVTGSSLDALMKRGLLPVTDILEYASQIAKAMMAAHAAGVIHRDLKPSNIMVNGEGTVKLLDFGLAQLNPLLAVEEADTASNLTEFGAAVGTLQYMSPEQARGETVDERSDIFSFGVVLYEMAAGVKPFHASSAFGVMHAISYTEPKPLAECRPETPAKLCEIIGKCLKKDRESRYSNMQAVRAALRDASGTPESFSAPQAAPAIGPTARNWTRYRWAAAGLAVVLLALGLSPIGRSAWRHFRSGGLSQSLLPGEGAEWTRRGHSYLFRYDQAGNVDKAIESFKKALQSDGESAAAYAGLGETYAQKYAENPDPQWLRLARSNAVRAVQLNDLLADSHVSMGLAELRSGKPQNAERELRRALDLEPGNSDAALRLGASLVAQGRAKEAEESYRKLLKTHPDDWRPYHFLGALLYDMNRYEEALAIFQQAAKLAPDNAAVYRLMGAAYEMLDRDAEAAQALQKALAIRPTPYVLSNLGMVYYYSGRYQDAASAFQRALATGANDYVLWGNLGDAYRFTPGKEAKAKEAYQQAIRLVKEQIGANPDLGSRMAVYLAKSGQKEEAWQAVQHYRNESKIKPISLYNLGVASELCGHRDQALKQLGEAVRLGLPARVIKNDPDLLALRSDPGYHTLVLAQAKPQ